MGMDLIEGTNYNMAGGDTGLIGDFINLGGSVTNDITNALENTGPTNTPTIPTPTRTV